MYTALFVCALVWVVTVFPTRGLLKSYNKTKDTTDAIAGCIFAVPCVISWFAGLTLAAIIVVREINS